MVLPLRIASRMGWLSFLALSPFSAADQFKLAKKRK
jgi:hypothetical protein